MSELGNIKIYFLYAPFRASPQILRDAPSYMFLQVQENRAQTLQR